VVYEENALHIYDHSATHNYIIIKYNAHHSTHQPLPYIWPHYQHNN